MFKGLPRIKQSTFPEPVPGGSENDPTSSCTPPLPQILSMVDLCCRRPTAPSTNVLPSAPSTADQLRLLAYLLSPAFAAALDDQQREHGVKYKRTTVTKLIGSLSENLSDSNEADFVFGCFLSLSNSKPIISSWGENKVCALLKALTKVLCDFHSTWNTLISKKRAMMLLDKIEPYLRKSIAVSCHTEDSMKYFNFFVVRIVSALTVLHSYGYSDRLPVSLSLFASIPRSPVFSEVNAKIDSFILLTLPKECPLPLILGALEHASRSPQPSITEALVHMTLRHSSLKTFESISRALSSLLVASAGLNSLENPPAHTIVEGVLLNLCFSQRGPVSRLISEELFVKYVRKKNDVSGRFLSQVVSVMTAPDCQIQQRSYLADVVPRWAFNDDSEIEGIVKKLSRAVLSESLKYESREVLAACLGKMILEIRISIPPEVKAFCDAALVMPLGTESAAKDAHVACQIVRYGRVLVGAPQLSQTVRSLSQTLLLLGKIKNSTLERCAEGFLWVLIVAKDSLGGSQLSRVMGFVEDFIKGGGGGTSLSSAAVELLTAKSVERCGKSLASLVDSILSLEPQRHPVIISKTFNAIFDLVKKSSSETQSMLSNAITPHEYALNHVMGRVRGELHEVDMERWDEEEDAIVRELEEEAINRRELLLPKGRRGVLLEDQGLVVLETRPGRGELNDFEGWTFTLSREATIDMTKKRKANHDN